MTPGEGRRVSAHWELAYRHGAEIARWDRSITEMYDGVLKFRVGQRLRIDRIRHCEVECFLS